jgi:hypothetical protein
MTRPEGTDRFVTRSMAPRNCGACLHRGVAHTRPLGPSVDRKPVLLGTTEGGPG